jgi:hypothetical protein
MSERAVMSKRAQELAAAFEQANDEVIASIEGCSDEQLRTVCNGEGWPVVVAAHHLALSYPAIFGMVMQIANREPIESFTSEDLDRLNAHHAEEHANVSREEALDLLRRKGAAAAAGVRTLSDEQLDRSAALALIGGQTWSAAQLIEGALIGHPKDHGGSIKAALAG